MNAGEYGSASATEQGQAKRLHEKPQSCKHYKGPDCYEK